ncbi:MAG TPA: YbdD/YjiX family protein [Burkholderiales bacterium]|nr:YbdD/YjiX family protein [Burkholderiales bacterium]
MERLGADSRRGQLLRTPANTGWRLMQAVWRFVRQVSGDDAYERYRDHILQAHPGQPAMTRTAYYRFRTEQKWNRITRCC